MKRLIKAFAVFITVFTSCNSIKKTVRDSYRYEMYIDYKYISYQGKNSTQDLCLNILSTDGMWYNGELIINGKDTVAIRGFEKGHQYPSTYKHPHSGENKHMDIWCGGETGQIRDSVIIKDDNPVNGLINEAATLYRKSKKCTSN